MCYVVLLFLKRFWEGRKVILDFFERLGKFDFWFFYGNRMIFSSGMLLSSSLGKLQLVILVEGFVFTGFCQGVVGGRVMSRNTLFRVEVLQFRFLYRLVFVWFWVSRVKYSRGLLSGIGFIGCIGFLEQWREQFRGSSFIFGVGFLLSRSGLFLLRQIWEF